MIRLSYPDPALTTLKEGESAAPAKPAAAPTPASSAANAAAGTAKRIEEDLGCRRPAMVNRGRKIATTPWRVGPQPPR